MKRLRENVRQQFSWKALALCPSKKNAVAIFLLYVNTLAFWGGCQVRYRLEGS